MTILEKPELIIQTITLAIVQGITEFLPISSSAHLILTSQLLGWQDQGLWMDVALHFGTLMAVIWLFKAEVIQVIKEVTNPQKLIEAGFKGQGISLRLLIATLPIVIAGFLLKDLVATELRNMLVIAAATIIFALLLWYADHQLLQREKKPKDKIIQATKESYVKYTVETLPMMQCFLIGCFQVFALIPGASRAGVVITAALLFGLNRVQSARFALLLALPTIAGAITLAVAEIIGEPAIVYGQNDGSYIWLLMGAVIAAVIAYLSMLIFLRWLKGSTMMPFIIYRMILGFGLFGLYLSQ